MPPGLAPGLPGGPGGNPYLQPPQVASPVKPHYDTGMPDGWRTNPGDPMEQQRQKQRLAMGTLA
jgi:hypothetical protein